MSTTDKFGSLLCTPATPVPTGFPWLDVTASPFFADPTGVRDASGAINQALVAAQSSKGNVLVPGGTYLIGAPLIVPSGVTLFGVGLASRLQAVSITLPAIFPTLGPTSAVVYVAQSDVTTVVRDLWIRGAHASGTAGSTTSGVYVDTSAQSCQVLHCKITDHSHVGLFINGDGHLVDGNHFENNAIDGIQVFARDGRIVNNFSINDSSDPANGIGWLQLLAGCQRILVANNNVVTPIHAGITLSSTAAAITQSCAILDNVIYFPGQRGIQDGGSANLKIIGNTVEGPRGSGNVGSGIYLFNVEGFVVVGNTVVDANIGTAAGIEADGSTHLGLISNNLSTTNGIGIAIRDTAGVGGTIEVSHNLLWSNVVSDFFMNPGVPGRFVFAAWNTFGQNGNPINITFLPSFANNAAAQAGGLVGGDLYRTGGDPDVVAIVH